MFTCKGAIDFYQQRFPDAPEQLWQLVPNGYDEKMFEGATTTQCKNSGEIRLLHAGTIYPIERDPTLLFQALANLKNQGQIRKEQFKVILRATSHDHQYAPMLEQLKITDLVTLEPAIPYKEALNEMLEVEALLLLQAANCNFQVPAKAYEYIRAQKPILALTDEAGDTADVIKQSQMAIIAPLDDVAKIELAIVSLIEKIRTDKLTVLPMAEIERFSRDKQAQRLAVIIDDVIGMQEK
ncbi:hypothetical protein GCM10009092_37390 [Bowmanella denitrificans]|uniref:Glycosyl transferase family 1 domain-containing protein n=2 Tax=Bowmanella denitrificans TaxID=366582 RepID=A0ABP3HHC6_9ALTE